MNNKTKNIIKAIKTFLKVYKYNRIQTFFTPSISGDFRVIVYENKKDITKILYAPEYDYIEIYGLNKEEQKYIMESKYCY